MTPYSIRCLLSLISEKRRMIGVLTKQIEAIDQTLNTEINLLVTTAIPGFASEMFVEFRKSCDHATNPLGYCTYDRHAVPIVCLFCEKPPTYLIPFAPATCSDAATLPVANAPPID